MNSDGYSIKTECIKALNLDIVGLAETHLINKKSITMVGYTWFGQNRTSLHYKARRGSGGIGFLIKNSLFKCFDIQICVTTLMKGFCGST